VTLPSLHSNVSSSLEDNDASPFVGPSTHLHFLIVLEGKNVDLEMPKLLQRFGESW
jgi:hypothetical protein